MIAMRKQPHTTRPLRSNQTPCAMLPLSLAAHDMRKQAARRSGGKGEGEGEKERGGKNRGFFAPILKSDRLPAWPHV